MNKLDNEKLISLVVYKLKDTLFNLMYDICDNPVDEIALPPECVKGFETEIRNLYLEIGDMLDTDITNRQEFNNKLNDLENRIVKKAVDINKYTCANNQLGEYVLREMKLIEVENIKDNIPLNNHAMVENVSHYLTHLPKDIEGSFAKGMLMSVLPLRMTKDRYKDYIKNAFGIMAKELPSEFAGASMDRLKDMGYTSIENIKEDFPLMYDTIAEIYKLPTSSFDKNNIEEYLNLIDDNINTLQNVYTCLGVLYNDITYMRVLSDFVVDEDFIFGEDLIIKDLYYSICDTIRDNDNTLLETITENLSNTIEERFEASKGLEAEISKAIDEIKDFDEIDDNAKISIQVNNAISSAYTKDIDQQIMLGNSNEKSVEALAEELCDYIEDSVTEYPIPRQKYIKQKFLQHLPCPMSDNELSEYAHYSLDGISDRHIGLMCCGDIFSITDKVEKEHHHHEHNHSHNHSDGCGCGHDHSHHHDDNCSCGHHHH